MALAPSDYYSGMATRPDYNPLINNGPGGDRTLLQQFQLKPQTAAAPSSILPQLQSQLGGINLNTQGLDLLRQKATATGPSAWENLATQQQQQGEQTQRNQAAAGAAGSAAGARSNLAMQGGLTGGARERLAMGGERALNEANQNIGAQGAAARTGISIQGEQQKNALLSQLPGQEAASLAPQFEKANLWANLASTEQGRNQANNQFNAGQNLSAQQFNAAQGIGENRNAAQQQLDAYNNQMKTWAAGKQADATANSGK